MGKIRAAKWVMIFCIISAIISIGIVLFIHDSSSREEIKRLSDLGWKLNLGFAYVFSLCVYLLRISVSYKLRSLMLMNTFYLSLSLGFFMVATAIDPEILW